MLMLASRKGAHDLRRRGTYRGLLSAFALASAGLMAHCGGGGDDDDNNNNNTNGNGPCSTVYQAQCGVTCSDAAPCATGLFCSNGACTAQCTSEGGCGNGQVCTSNGRCVSNSGGNGSAGSGFGGGINVGGSNNNNGGTGGQCAGVTVEFTPVIPTVVVLVDQSGSMDAQIPDDQPGEDPTRWDALRDALLNETSGAIKPLEGKVRFGLVTYSWNGEQSQTCPFTPVQVAPKLNNYSAIAEAYLAADTEDNTPTAESVDKVHKQILKPITEPGPKFLIIATDGNPDYCGDRDSNGQELPKQMSIAAVKAAYADGISTFVIGIDFLKEPNGEQHLRDLAAAGQGKETPSTENLYFNADNQAGVRTAFETVINSVTRSCEFDLDATIETSAAPLGTVKIDNVEQTYNNPNGWSLADNDTIVFVGSACDAIKAGATNVEASFPCNTAGVVIKPR
jgi:von Willebrand factor type A domain